LRATREIEKKRYHWDATLTMSRTLPLYFSRETSFPLMSCHKIGRLISYTHISSLLCKLTSKWRRGIEPQNTFHKEKYCSKKNEGQLFHPRVGAATMTVDKL
jgi:hypothetical protein